MRIAIFTFHRAYNCGAMLQAWALKNILERMGHEVRFLTSNELGRIPPSTPWSKRAKSGSVYKRFRSAFYRAYKTILGERYGVKTGILYDNFRKAFLPELECDDLHIDNFFDIVIVGSDQVLCPTIDGWSQHFICTNVPDTVPKIIYSGSCGDKEFDKQTERLIDAALTRFSSISVRESYKGYDVVLDPTLLLDVEDYSTIICNKKPLENEPYLYVYSCTCTDYEISVARRLSKKLGVKLIISNPWGRYFRNDIKEMVEWMSPALMIQYIRNASYVIAGSFHATVLSFLHDKPFLTLRNQIDISASRPETFLRRFNLLSHFANPGTSYKEMEESIQKPISSKSYDILRLEREYSMRWLFEAIHKFRVKL